MSSSPTNQQIAPLSEVSKVPGKMHNYNSVGSFGALSFCPKGLCLLLWSTTFPDTPRLNLLLLLVGLVHWSHQVRNMLVCAQGACVQELILFPVGFLSFLLKQPHNNIPQRKVLHGGKGRLNGKQPFKCQLNERKSDQLSFLGLKDKITPKGFEF